MKRVAKESPGEPQMPATILVMDDDECMRGLLRLHLSNAGYTVLVAEDAIDAGHLLLQQLPDLILADVEMPFMDGLEFLRAVKADRATRTTTSRSTSVDSASHCLRSTFTPTFSSRPRNSVRHSGLTTKSGFTCDFSS